MSRRGKGVRQAGKVRQKGGPRRSRNRDRLLRWPVLLALLVLCGLGVALAVFFALRGWSSGTAGPPRAAIVDHLALTFPDPAFVQEATSTLQEAGYSVDYYPGEQVTVDFYRGLGTRGYDFIVLRVHAARLRRADGTAYDEVALFTSEPYSTSTHIDEQRAKYLIRTRYSAEDQRRFFGIMPEFVESEAKGTFDGATVILMGCDGLRSEATARAFVKRGAAAFIGWDKEVSAERTDQATLLLLRSLLLDHLGTGEAVAQTMSEVGPDPSFDSHLRYYPAEAAASGAP